MLQAKTKEQQEQILAIAKGNILSDDVENGIEIDGYISYEEMTAIVDYLRSVNKPKKSELDMSIVALEMMPVVEEWLAYKQEKKQSYKPKGFKNFYKRLCDLSNNDPRVAMMVIEQSMANNYDGIFPLKQNNSNNSYGRETITDKIRRTVENATEFKQHIDESIGGQTFLDFGDSDKVW